MILFITKFKIIYCFSNYKIIVNNNNYYYDLYFEEVLDLFLI